MYMPVDIKQVTKELDKMLRKSYSKYHNINSEEERNADLLIQQEGIEPTFRVLHGFTATCKLNIRKINRLPENMMSAYLLNEINLVAIKNNEIPVVPHRVKYSKKVGIFTNHPLLFIIGLSVKSFSTPHSKKEMQKVDSH